MESQENNESRELILAASGEPFKNEKGAKSAMTSKGYTDKTAEIVGYGEGFAIQPLGDPVKPDKVGKVAEGYVVQDDSYFEGEVVLQTIYMKPGVPFLTAKDAQGFITRNRINIGTNRIIGCEGGFAIYGDGQKAPVPPKEKYWWVTFNERSNETDPEDVQLSVNGETLIIQRGKKVIIPDRYKECAEHALIQKFVQLPDKPRKHLSPIMKFPFTTHGEATEAEFRKMKTEGTKKTDENIRRYGFEVTPDQVEEYGN